MRLVSLRSFRTLGAKALGAVPEGETVVLSGQDGPAYFLVPVLGDLEAESKELRRAMARSRLRQNWAHAKAAGAGVSDAAMRDLIEAEVSLVRSRKTRKAPR